MSLKNFMSYDDAATVLGEYADKVNELKSGLTNVDVALSVPTNSGKNVLPLTLANLKSRNTTGTWSGNSYTVNGVTFTAQMDDDGNVTGITANGTASGESDFYLEGKVSKTKYSGCIMSGCVGGSDSTYYIQYIQDISPWKNQKQTNDTIQLSEFPENINVTIRIVVSSGVELTDKAFYPMIRPATITDPTFAPYIPSVDARLDAVESGLDDVNSNLSLLSGETIYTTDSDIASDLYNNTNYVRHVIMKDTTKTMALLNTIDREVAHVILLCNRGIWTNHPNFIALVNTEVFVGVLNITGTGVSVVDSAKLAWAT